MSRDECYLLGYISRAHGVSGEVCFLIDADDPAYYKKMESVFIEINKQLVPFFISKISIRQNLAYVRLEDVDTEEQAEALTGKSLFLPLSFLPPLKDQQFYFHEIIGFEVVDRNHGPLGPIREVYDYPHQIVIGVSYGDKEVLFPLNDHTLLNVDKPAKRMDVELPEGLLEVYL